MEQVRDVPRQILQFVPVRASAAVLAHENLQLLGVADAHVEELLDELDVVLVRSWQ